MKNILVTGGTGYVGSGFLRELLLKGYNATCLDNLLFGGESLLDFWHNKNFSFYNSNINDSEKLIEIFSKKILKLLVWAINKKLFFNYG